VRFVGEGGQLRQLAFLDQGADGSFKSAFVDAVGDRGDDDLPPFSGFLQFPFALDANAAAAFFINVAERAAVGDDFTAERKIGAFEAVEYGGRGGFRVVDQSDGRLDHIFEIVRRNVRRHADGDAGGAVHQDIRKLGRQDGRLVTR